METYKIKFHLQSEMTDLPDSQKLFGWLMAELAKTHKNGEISQFVKAVREKQTVCRLSNLLPDGYLPMPKSFLLKKWQEIQKPEQINKADYKLIKKMDFIKSSDAADLLAFLAKPETDKVEQKLKEIVYIKKERQYFQKFRLESEFYQLPGLPNKAYAISVLRLRRVQPDKDGHAVESLAVKDYEMWIEVDENNLLAKHLKQNEKQGGKGFYMGTKASQGYNHFRIKEIKKIEQKKKVTGGADLRQEQRNYYLNMGMLLPLISAEKTRINYDKSFLNLHTSDRRPIDNVKSAKKWISFIDSGSVLHCDSQTSDELEGVSQSIKNNYNFMYEEAIVFGDSYLLRLDRVGSE